MAAFFRAGCAADLAGVVSDYSLLPCISRAEISRIRVPAARNVNVMCRSRTGSVLLGCGCVTPTRWWMSIILTGVLPHDGMLPVSWLSFCVHPARRATFVLVQADSFGSDQYGPLCSAVSLADRLFLEAPGWHQVLMLPTHRRLALSDDVCGHRQCRCFLSSRFILQPASRYACAGDPAPFPSLALLARS